MSLRILLMFTMGCSALVWSMNGTNEKNTNIGEKKLDEFEKTETRDLPYDLGILRDVIHGSATLRFGKSFNFANLPELKSIEEILQRNRFGAKLGRWTCEKSLYHDEVWCRNQNYKN